MAVVRYVLGPVAAAAAMLGELPLQQQLRRGKAVMVPLLALASVMEGSPQQTLEHGHLMLILLAKAGTSHP